MVVLELVYSAYSTVRYSVIYRYLEKSGVVENITKGMHMTCDAFATKRRSGLTRQLESIAILM